MSKLNVDDSSWCLGYIEAINNLAQNKKDLISEFVKKLNTIDYWEDDRGIYCSDYDQIQELTREYEEKLK